MSTRPLSDGELQALLARVARLGDRGWRQQAEAGLGLFSLRAPDAECLDDAACVQDGHAGNGSGRGVAAGPSEREQRRALGREREDVAAVAGP